MEQYSAVQKGRMVAVYVAHHWDSRNPLIGKVLKIENEDETFLIHWYGASWTGRCSPSMRVVAPTENQRLNLWCFLKVIQGESMNSFQKIIWKLRVVAPTENWRLNRLNVRCIMLWQFNLTMKPTFQAHDLKNEAHHINRQVPNPSPH